MALTKDKKLKKTSITIPNAYCRIDWQRYDTPNRVGLGVGVYENEAAANPPVLDAEGEPKLDDDGKPITIASTANQIDLIDYEFTVEDFGDKSKINAAQSYALLKAKEEWSDAEDC